MTPTKNTGSLRAVSDREFVLEYTFDAPAARVFAAYTDPKLVPLWWANKGSSIRVDRMDVRPGGEWRFVQRSGDGPEMAFRGVYREVKPVTRLVYTFVAEANPGREIVATVELAERDGKTHLTLTNLCGSKEERDGMVQYGAEAGARVAWDRLAEVLRRPSGT
ncbi:MAG: SRPBCC domain-containing protein [Halobacteriales archaeon]|nr:SRPBCC domain-containing protein [Halobacteriales archaeon]